MCAHVPSPHSDAIQDGMRLMRQCPLCQQDYEFDHIDIIEEDAGAHLVHITCTSCAGKMLAILMMSNFGMSSVGMITDLNSEDVHRLGRTEALSADDVLGLYEALHTKDVFEGALVQQTRTHYK